MASNKEFKEFILEQLNSLHNIVCKSMMGEYLLYYNGILFGGIYDNRLLIKKTKSNFIYALEEVVPYDNAKPMYMVDNLDDVQYLSKLILDTCNDLK